MYSVLLRIESDFNFWPYGLQNVIWNWVQMRSVPEFSLHSYLGYYERRPHWYVSGMSRVLGLDWDCLGWD